MWYWYENKWRYSVVQAQKLSSFSIRLFTFIHENEDSVWSLFHSSAVVWCSNESYTKVMIFISCQSGYVLLNNECMQFATALLVVVKYYIPNYHHFFLYWLFYSIFYRIRYWNVVFIITGDSEAHSNPTTVKHSLSNCLLFVFLFKAHKVLHDPRFSVYFTVYYSNCFIFCTWWLWLYLYLGLLKMENGIALMMPKLHV